MNPSSLDIDLWLRRAKGSAVQRQKDMYKYFGSKLIDDEARRTSFKNNYGVRQQPERSGAHEADEGGRITYQ